MWTSLSRYLAVAVVLFASLSACGKSSPTAPPPAPCTYTLSDVAVIVPRVRRVELGHRDHRKSVHVDRHVRQGLDVDYERVERQRRRCRQRQRDAQHRDRRA